MAENSDNHIQTQLIELTKSAAGTKAGLASLTATLKFLGGIVFFALLGVIGYLFVQTSNLKSSSDTLTATAEIISTDIRELTATMKKVDESVQELSIDVQVLHTDFQNIDSSIEELKKKH